MCCSRDAVSKDTKAQELMLGGQKSLDLRDIKRKSCDVSGKNRVGQRSAPSVGAQAYGELVQLVER